MKFWLDLRRRRVFRFAGLYIVGAWLVFQIADVFFPAWGVPDSALRYLLYAALACFPIALVFSWFYDVSTSGIVRTRPTGEEESLDLALKRTDYLVLAGLLVVAGAILFGSFDRVVQSAGEAPVVEAAKEKPVNSIAVLPFDNLDTNPDTGYFSDGVSEEILHRLASIRALKVIGRTSSFAFGDADMGLDRISDLLGVRYLLNGSIRSDGNQVRLTARLVDDSGYQVWSESFDGELKDIFSFQSEIAEQVASEINRELVMLKPPESARTTQSTEAYRQYLIGKAYFHQRTPNWQDNAAEAYRRSIAEDPEFAPPYAALAIAFKSGASIDNPDAMWIEANGLIDRALELDPELPEALMAKGFPHTEEPGFNLDRNIENLERALELDPSLGTAYNWLAIAYRWSGRNAEADTTFDRGLAVDPLNPPLIINSADRHLARGDFDTFRRQIMALLELPEPPGFLYRVLLGKHSEYGYLSEALSWAKEAVRAYAPSSIQDLQRLALLYMQLGNSDEADYWASQLALHAPQSIINQTLVNLSLLLARGEPETLDDTLTRLESSGLDLEKLPAFLVRLLAEIRIAAGQYSIGITMLEQVSDFSQPPNPDRPPEVDDVKLVHLLAFAKQQAGRESDAAAMVARAAEMTEIINSNRWFFNHPDLLMLPVIDHAAMGELSEAADALRKAFEGGWRDYYREATRPFWRGAWQSDEFAPVVADIITDIERQRAVVEAIEAEHDFRIEFESLMAESDH